MAIQRVTTALMMMVTVMLFHGPAKAAADGSTETAQPEPLNLFGDSSELKPVGGDAPITLTPVRADSTVVGEIQDSPTPTTAVPLKASTGTENDDQQVIRRPVVAESVANPREQQTVSRERSHGTWSFIDLLPLLAVLALIAGAAWMVKRFLPARSLLGGGSVMQIIARTSLSGKQHIVLLKVGRRLVLLGVTSERISQLSTIDDADEIATIMGEVASRRPDSMNQAFGKLFSNESSAFQSLSEEDAELETGGQVRGLLEKVRQLSRGSDVISESRSA